MNRLFSLVAALAFASGSSVAFAQQRDARSDEQLIVQNVEGRDNADRDRNDRHGADAAVQWRDDADPNVRNEPDVYIDARHHHRYHRDPPVPLLGALVGGLIGNQFGRGDGRAAATIAGAAIGYAAGESSERYDDGYYDARYDYAGPGYGYYGPGYGYGYGYPRFGYSIGVGYFGGGYHHHHDRGGYHHHSRP